MLTYEDIREYYRRRGYKWPTATEAMLFVIEEVGESAAKLLDLKRDWIRNHPENHQPDEDGLAEELGDAIFMLKVVGMLAGVDDPEVAVRRKLEGKVGSLDRNTDGPGEEV